MQPINACKNQLKTIATSSRLGNNYAFQMLACCTLIILFSSNVYAEPTVDATSWLSNTQPDPSDPAGQFKLGKMYDKGEGVPRDQALALSWYRKAAEQGYPAAQLLLGIIYDQAIGVPQDYSLALLWYRKAAEQGYAKAQYNLAAMFDAGLGTPQDYQLAADWYLKAAEQGFAKAQYNLGSMYFSGEGVHKSNVKAWMWLQLAAEQGLQQEVKQRLEMENSLSEAEIKKAKKMLKDWKAGHKQLKK